MPLDDTVVANILLRIESTGLEKVAAAQAQLVSLDASVAGLATAADAAVVPVAAAGDATALAGVEARGAGISYNEFKVAMLGAGAASERNVGGLLALGASGAGLIPIIAALGVGFEYFATKSAVSFQSAMERIRTEAGASQHEVDAMTQAVLTMASQVGTAPDQLAEALFHIESAGLRGAAALALLRTAADGAHVGNADLISVTNALIAVTNSHIAGVHGQESAMAALNAIVGSSNLHLQDLTDSLKTGILPAAKAAGLTLQDVGAAMAVMSINGIPAERGMTQLRMTLAMAEAPGTKAATALASIGMTQGQVARDLRQPNGLLVAVSDLSTHLQESGLTAQEQAAVILDAFGKRSAQGIQTLIDNVSLLAQKYADQGAQAKKYAADRTAEQATAAHQWDVLIAKAQTYFDIIGKASLPAFTGLLKTLNDVTGAMDATGSALDRFNTEGQKLQAWQDSASHSINNFLGVLFNYAPGFDTSSVSAEHLATSTDHVSQSTIRLKENLIAETAIHGQAGSVAEQHVKAIDHLSSAYDRLIAASKAYTASAASQGATGINAATSGLQAAIAPLAPDFRAALQPVLDDFIAKLHTEQENYLRKVSDGDATYQQKLTALHDAYLQKSAGLDGAKLAKETQAYDQSVKNLKAEHDRHNADLQATFLAHVQGIEKAMKAQAEPGALFATLQTKVNELATTDLNALSYAITTHSGRIAQATAAAVRAEADKERVDNAALASSTRVALALGDLSTAISNEQKRLTQEKDVVASGIFKGESAGKIDKEIAAAAKHEASLGHMTAAEDQAALKIARASGDYAAYLSALQKQLQDQLSSAEGRVISDQRPGGNAADLPAARQAVDEARTRLQHLSATISELEGKATKAVDQFAVDLTNAQNKAKESLDALALAIDNGDSPGKIHRLALEAEAAGQRLAKLGLASDRAAILGGSPSEQIAARADIAKRALDALAMGIADHDTPGKLRLLGDEAQRAAAAEAKVTEAQLRAAERVGTPSQRLSASEQDEQGKRANAEATITLAIEDHKKVTKEDIAAAQEHERAVQRDTQAQWDAAFAAASVSERHAMLAQQASGLISRFQTLQSATQSVIDAQMAYSADQTNILKIRLDNLAKSYEDATAILQARNASIKDQGTAGVTAVTDTSGILKAQSDILSAILQVGLSSKQESAATAAQAIQVAEDQLAVARDQQTIDEAAAAAQQKIDADNVTIAQDRATQDDLQGRMTLDLAYQQLQLDHDKIQLAKDQLKLTELTNQGIAIIASHFGDVSGYNHKIEGVLHNIEADNIQIDADQKGALSVTTGWLGIIAAATKQVDQDTRQLATDQAASDSGTSAGQTRIATDQQLVQADQAYLQDLQAVDQATQSVTDAFNQLASDQSKMVVDSYNAMVTAVNDATSVFQAMSGVSKASADGQIKAVQDQSAIIKAEGDIASAKSSQQLAVARDELTIAEDTLTMDQTNARWAIRLATDQVKLAEDKAAADAVKAAWDHTIDLDIIKVDQDKVKLAEDQLLLTEENLSLQAQVVDLLGGDSSGSLSQMPQILQQISGDQAAIATDQATQQRDQQLAAQQEAAMALQTAYDQQQMARDQAAADAASAAGQMRLAQDGNKLAADQVAEQQQSNKLLSMSLSEMQQWFSPMLDAMRNLRSGIDYHWVGSGPNPFETFINSAPASFSMNPSP